jgi:hypothetical protein
MSPSSLDELAIKETICLIKATERYVLPKIYFETEKRAYALAYARAISRLNESRSFAKAKKSQEHYFIKEIKQLSNKRSFISNPNKYYKLALSHIEDAYNSVDIRFFTGCSDHIFWWR